MTTIPSGTLFSSRFTILRALRSDLIGQVYLAKDRDRNEQEIQLTVIAAEISSNPKLLAALARTLRAALLVNSPYVLKTLDFDCLGLSPFVVQEHASGATLDSMIGQTKALAIPEALKISKEALLGLEDIHGAGLLHLGLSPNSLLVTENGQIKLLNNGCSPVFKTEIQTLDCTNSIQHFAAPELLENRGVSIRSDLHSIGLIAYQLITGHCPFSGLSGAALRYKKLNSNPQAPHQLADDCPAPLSAAIMRACALPEAIRFHSAREMLLEFSRIAPAESPPPSPSSGYGTRLFIGDLPVFLLSRLLPAGSRAMLEPLEKGTRALQILPRFLRTSFACLSVAIVVALILLSSISTGLNNAEVPFNAETEFIPNHTALRHPDSDNPDLNTPPPTRYSEYLIGDTSGLTGKLIFSAGKDGNRKILLLDLEAKKISGIVDDSFDNIEPALSADGTLLAYVRLSASDSTLVLLNLENPESLVEIPNSSYLRFPSFSPDKSQIAAALQTPPRSAGEESGSELALITIETGEVRIITQLGGRNTSPRWNPISNQIAFVTDRFWPGSDLCLWELDLQKEECLRTGQANYLKPTWDPLGKRIAAVKSQDGKVAIERYELDSGKSSVLEVSGEFIFDPVFASGGGYFAVQSSGTEEGASLVFVGPHGEHRQIIIASHSIRSPIWLNP